MITNHFVLQFVIFFFRNRVIVYLNIAKLLFLRKLISGAFNT